MMQYPNCNSGMQVPSCNQGTMQPYQAKSMMPNAKIHCMPMLLAHAYVPFQCIGCIFPPMKGLDAGTIFPELYRPYGVDPEYTVDA
ncbi:spore coat associated protein CotJA [Acetivibrio mesophilus]|uniref:Spore coat associated protein CotJA n=1 Tax=Acetivibrio mesophilus TaxID=2487273 RepID=A0A4V1K2H5_9FIRM|nr:spore coat associated protein CotJA [Acetivibrio mesophilus]RXE60309.1 spore coat associated protein CotJA [Acetivibrio mesophilus]